MPLVWFLLVASAAAARQPVHIRNAMVVEGAGTPAFGPADVLIQNNRIARVGRRIETVPDARVIDGTGRWVLPGFVNMHGHLHHERAGIPMPRDYVLKLWLAAGITTVRDVGSDFARTKAAREESAAGRIEAPRLFLYPHLSAAGTPREQDARVKKLKEDGADGIKLTDTPRDLLRAISASARAAGLPVAHHAGVAETNAWDDIEVGTRSIEHWYGIPDAALRDGVQRFPPGYNYANETDRFRWAGRLWREADPGKLASVLDAMVKANVAWDPTLNIYEACRDLQRAQNMPWFARYLHPALAKFFQPNADYHGSFFFHWTTEDETYWKENYRIWMNALADFERRGGLITAGEDAGYIYQVYGFGFIRELELHQEAGFHPLAVVKHATFNGAKALGRENELGRVREGWRADLVVVNGNPLENFKILYPHDSKIEWTIKDGIPYDGATLRREAEALAAGAVRKHRGETAK